MEIQKLFRVLVVGGASVAAGCTTTTPQPIADGGPASDAGPGSDAEPLAPEECFCGSEAECCDGAEVREGFVCCWATSC